MVVYSTRNEVIRPLKSRRGCKTCKIRRVKCGEERPNCQRCTSTGRKCEYDSSFAIGTFASAPPTISILKQAISSLPNTVWRERRAFAYYFQHAARYLAGGFDVEFWADLIPQVCRTEPAVWDAINAISILFESPEQCSDPVFLRRQNESFHAPSQNQKDALTWYSRSLSNIRLQIDRGSADPYVALITCVLYMCIETLQGRVEEALQLYGQGVNLINSLRSQISCTLVPASKVALLENTIIPFFVRLGTVALSISGVPANVLYDPIEGSQEYKFTSLHSARAAMAALAAEGMLFQRAAQQHFLTVGDGSRVGPSLAGKQRMLQIQLAHWRHAYDTFIQDFRRKNLSFPRSDTSTTATLLVYHAAISIIVSTCLTQGECIFDAHLSSFETIVNNSALILDASTGPDGMQPPFTFEMGVGLPLFLTALKCRDRQLRHKALNLLQKAPPVQGLYKCAPGVMIARKALQLEEDFSLLLKKDIEYNAYCPNTGSTGTTNTEIVTTQDFSDSSDNTQVHGSATELPASKHNRRAELLRECYTDEDTDQIPDLIPEKARIEFVGIFRPENGLPPTVSEHDVAQWKRGKDQTFFVYRRHQRDHTNDIWRLIEEFMPIDS
ncbi:putative C6 finger domain protein [Aspergillus alliaceus]|uniref:Putative C6 finger domain protein n=1 Tax=Petromyces alliaceus TaxID=209559 RepID=A0A5N7BS96_PETAA|nr:putative C6 finger domain protein [Aspergillus alliaceus]